MVPTILPGHSPTSLQAPPLLHAMVLLPVVIVLQLRARTQVRTQVALQWTRRPRASSQFLRTWGS